MYGYHNVTILGHYWTFSRGLPRISVRRTSEISGPAGEHSSTSQRPAPPKESILGRGTRPSQPTLHSNCPLGDPYPADVPSGLRQDPWCPIALDKLSGSRGGPEASPSEQSGRLQVSHRQSTRV